MIKIFEWLKKYKHHFIIIGIILLIIWAIIGNGIANIKNNLEKKYYKDTIEQVSKKYMDMSSKYNDVVKEYDKAIVIYQDNLKNVINDFNGLLKTYNDVIKKYIITDILIENSYLYVILRNGAIEIKRIKTSVCVSEEIFIDYVLYQNRIIFRRVFDANTAPSKAIDLFSDINLDWKDNSLQYGKIIYKKFTEDGLYHITIQLDGNLGLEKYSKDEKMDYLPSPEIKKFQEREDFKKFETYNPSLDDINNYKNEVDQMSIWEIIIKGLEK